MIDRERVCEMTKLVAYEQQEGKRYHGAMRFYRRDFVGRHLIKGFFCATVAFGLMLLAWGVCHMEELIHELPSMDVIQFGISILVRYLLFLIVYLIGVAVYANMHYAAGRRSQKRHLRRLKHLGRLYKEQEERAAAGLHGSTEDTARP